MLAALKRHPFPVVAHFRRSVVLTYAFPARILEPLLPPSLHLDTYEGWGFLAIALVETEALRPAGLPRWMGRDFFLSGYRIFTRFRGADGRDLRGLRILRSDTDSRIMAFAGNLLTHYNYRVAKVASAQEGDLLKLSTRTPGAEADLDLVVDLAVEVPAPPAGSPFPDLRTARRYAGPLPHTFEREAGSGHMIVIEGTRTHWEPRPVEVRTARATFFDQEPFRGVEPVLANAFSVENVSYRWKRGRRMAPWEEP